MDEARFQLTFGETDSPSRGELIVYRPLGSFGARVELVVEGDAPPPNLHAKAALAAAAEASGLGLALRLGWKRRDGFMVRECALVGDNHARLRELFPGGASA